MAVMTPPPVQPDYRLADIAGSLVWVIFGLCLTAAGSWDPFDPVPALAEAPRWQVLAGGVVLVVSAGLQAASQPPHGLAYQRLRLRMIGNVGGACALLWVAGISLQQYPFALGWGAIGFGFGAVHVLRAVATWRRIQTLPGEGV